MEDLKGLKLRFPTRLAGEALKALGANAIGMPIPQVPESLAQRVIDGAVIPWEVVPAVKVQELVKFHTEIPGSPTLYTATFILAMNRVKYDGLPADLKAVIDKNSGQVGGRDGWPGLGRAGGRGVGDGEEARQHDHDAERRGGGALAHDDRAGHPRLGRVVEGQEPRRGKAPRVGALPHREVREDGVKTRLEPDEGIEPSPDHRLFGRGRRPPRSHSDHPSPMPSEAGSAPLPPDRGILGRLTLATALAGGLLSIAVALLVTASVTGRWFGVGAVPGDFELVKIAVAVSVFCFLPFTQMRRGNIVVDTFTSRLPPRINRAIDAFWDLVFAAMIGLLAWCTVNGAQEALGNGLNSMVLGLPLGPVFVVCAVLLTLLALTAVATAARLLGSYEA
jgi:TRAP-type C4-dicarboxylate transport system permease small subunit